jgi:hypothetical protein
VARVAIFDIYIVVLRFIEIRYFRIKVKEKREEK